VGNYVNDHHYPGDDWPLAPKACRWGGRWTGTPFCIPYGCVQSAAIVNLLTADKAISTSHMANGATRLQPLVLNVGQAAGAAAAQAVRSSLTPAQITVWDVQKSLLIDAKAPAAVAPDWQTAWHHPCWLERQLSLLNRTAERTRPISHTGRESSQPEPVRQRIQTIEGILESMPDETFFVNTSDGARVPIITLEPSVAAVLNQLSAPSEVLIEGTYNSAGSWIVASKIVAA
jgi:hypothetical protein